MLSWVKNRPTIAEHNVHRSWFWAIRGCYLAQCLSTLALTWLPLVEGGTGSAMTGEDPPKASSLPNLLPLANASLCLLLAGAYVSDGMPPVQVKLVARIKRWEYIEMGELLPEFWVSTKGGEGEGSERKARQSRKVTDLNTGCNAMPFIWQCSDQEPQVLL